MNKQDEGLFWKSTIIREQSNVKIPSRAEEEEHEYAGRTPRSPFQGWKLTALAQFLAQTSAQTPFSSNIVRAHKRKLSKFGVFWYNLFVTRCHVIVQKNIARKRGLSRSFILRLQISLKGLKLRFPVLSTHIHKKVQSMNRRIACNKNNLQQGRQKILCLQNFWLDDINTRPFHSIAYVWPFNFHINIRIQSIISARYTTNGKCPISD